MTGRPTKFNPELATNILLDISGGMTILRVCKKYNIHRSTIYYWEYKGEEFVMDCPFRQEPSFFSDSLQRAKSYLASSLVDESLDIADDGTNDFYGVDSNFTDKNDLEKAKILRQQVNHENIQRSRVRIESRKMIAGTLNKNLFTTNVKQELSGPNGGPIKTETTINTNDMKQSMYDRLKVEDKESDK